MEKRVHRDLRAMLSIMPPMTITPETLEQVRTFFAAMPPLEPDETIIMTERLIPGPKGAPDVPVIIFEPAQRKQENAPGILYIHGGGYVLGGAKNITCHKIVKEIGGIVVSVDYRLAPENPFPAPLEDCYTALKWFSENAAELGVNPSNIAVVGPSAGGGLTAALSLLARDRKGPAIAFQMPIYPMIDDRNITPSSQEIMDARVWNNTSNINAWQMYLGSDHKGEVSQYAAAARATDLSGLPPTYTCVGELEPFRDEVIEYVARLTQAGVPTEFHLYPGVFHACEFFVPNAEIAQRIERGYFDALKRALERQ